jgi:hypothetical protein
MTDYQIDIKDNILTFSTTSFKAEKGSMLHSGIYNREMSAILAAGVCMVIAGFFFALRYELTAYHFLISLVAFIGLFICFRTFVFKEPLLTFQIDKGRGDATVSVRAFLNAKKAQYRLADLSDVRVYTQVFEPQNVDGIKVVEHVALQHGTVIPGFGETKTLHTVEVLFKDSLLGFYVSDNEDDAAGLAGKIKGFIYG